MAETLVILIGLRAMMQWQFEEWERPFGFAAVCAGGATLLWRAFT